MIKSIETMIFLPIFLLCEIIYGGPKKDYYETLGVSRDANQETIVKAHRNLARLYHPDVNPGNPDAEEKFKQLEEAYSILHDPQKRRLYDLYGSHENETRFEKLERKKRESGLTYFEAEEYTKLKWKTRKEGTSYEDAKAAFENNSYYASEVVGEYNLTQEQLFEFAFITAKQKGAVFTNLIKFYPIKDPLKRFEAGLVAAKTNNWSNVKFDIDAFGLMEFPNLKYKLAKAAITRSDYQIQFVGEWGFSKKQIYLLLQIASHGLIVIENLNLIPLTQRQRFEIFKRLASNDIVDTMPRFKEFQLTDSDLIYEAARYVALRSKYFGDYVKYLGISDKEKLRELAELNFTVKKSEAMRYAGINGFKLDDEKLKQLYFKNILPNEASADPLEDFLRSREIGRPARMARTTEKEQDDPIFFGASLLGPLFTEDNSSVYYRYLPEDWEFLRKYAEFSKIHPKLFPPQWISLVSRFAYQDSDIAIELLRMAYRLSDETHFFMPQEPLEILAQGSGINIEFLRHSYSVITLRALYRSLLSLNEYLGRPAFEDVKFSGSVFEPASIEHFIDFIDALTIELMKKSKWKEKESKEWPKLIRRFHLTENEIQLSRIKEIKIRLTRIKKARDTCTAVLRMNQKLSEDF